MSEQIDDKALLAKRHRNLMIFSVAVLVIGLAPAETQASFSFLGIQFRNIDPSYMWGWATSINVYLMLAWAYTSQTDDDWLRLKGGKLQRLLHLSDYSWIRHLKKRRYTRHGFERKKWGLRGNDRSFMKLVKTHEMIANQSFFRRKNLYNREDYLFISKDEFQNELKYQAHKGGYGVTVYEGRHHRKPFLILVRSHSGGNPHKEVRQNFTELYFTILPALAFGIAGISTALCNWFFA